MRVEEGAGVGGAEEGFGGVGFGIGEEGGLFGVAVSGGRGLLGDAFGEISALGVVEYQWISCIFIVFYGRIAVFDWKIGEEPGCNGGMGDEAGRIHFLGRESHDCGVHAVLGR